MLFSDLDLARRVERADAHNAFEDAQTLGRLQPELGAAAETSAGGCAVFAGTGSPSTQAVDLGLHGSVSEEEFDRLENFYRTRGVALEIEVCPLADPSLRELLGRRGYRVIEWSNVLVRPLGDADLALPPVSAVSVRRATAADVDVLSGILTECFPELKDQDLPARTLVEPVLHMPAAACFVGSLDGQAAGVASILLRSGVAMLAGGATLAAYRNRGVQAALNHARLALAASARCDLAVTMTLPGSASQRNAERRGFRIIYTRSKMAQ